MLLGDASSVPIEGILDVEGIDLLEYLHAEVAQNARTMGEPAHTADKPRTGTE